MSIFDLSDFFIPYEKIPQIANTLSQKNSIVSKLKLQLKDEYSLYLKGMSSQTEEVIKEAGLLVESTGVEFREEITRMVIQNILNPYKELFSKRDTKNIESIEKRYIWFTRQYNEFKGKLAKVFPHYWGLLAVLVFEFCGETCISVSEILSGVYIN